MWRGLSWLVAGLVLLGLIMVATAPELLDAEAGAVSGMFLGVLIAAVPGLVLLVLVAIRRQRSSKHDGEDRADG